MMSVETTTLRFKECELKDISACAFIEESSYPSDEAASREQLMYRQANASSFFRVCFHDDGNDLVLGFVCGTLCRTMNHETMSSHDPDGKILGIHSVVVADRFRRKGIASAMLRDYLATMERDHRYLKKIVLLAKSHLLSFYVNAGFSVVRPSPIVHGQDLWYDLERDLRPAYWIVDAFVTKNVPGSGNPAAIVVLTTECTDVEWMQHVAKQFNLSETAFVWPLNGEHSYRIRYFSPMTEVDLCGHATLAAAATLQQPEVCFVANHSTLLKACFDPSTSSVTMKFPVQPVAELVEPSSVKSVHTTLRKAFGFEIDDILFLGLVNGLGDLFIHVTDDAFDALKAQGTMNVEVLRECKHVYTRGVLVWCRRPVDETVVVSSRFFAPLVGIDEDPVTGSAHCALAPYCLIQGQASVVTARQESARGGCMVCKVDGNRVSLTGAATITMEGRLAMNSIME